MKRQWLLGVVVLLLASAAWATSPKTRGDSYTVGADVDPSGQVVAVAVGADVPDTIVPFLTHAVRQWRFQPPVIEGEPVTVHTWIVVDLRAVPSPDGKYTINVKFVSNGPKVDEQVKKAWRPKYPADRIRAHEQAFVVVKAVLNADGSIANPVAMSRVEGWPLHPSFVKSAEQVALQWHAEPERVDGKPVAGEVFFPVSYELKPIPRYSLAQIELLRAAARKRGDPNADAREVPLPTSDLVVTGNSLLTPIDTHTVSVGG